MVKLRNGEQFMKLPALLLTSFLFSGAASAGCNPCICGPGGDYKGDLTEWWAKNCPNGKPKWSSPIDRLPEWQWTTYVDCVSPEDKITRVRVAGNSSADSQGEATVLTVTSDSSVIAREFVHTHRYGPKEEVYESQSLKLTLQRSSTLRGVSGVIERKGEPLPARFLGCRQLR